MEEEVWGAPAPGGAPVGLPGFEQGRGRPLAFLPGLSLSHAPPRGLGRATEAALVAPLASHHRVHWVGRRRPVPAGFTIADFARDTAAHLRERFAGPVPVVGFSTGGFVALALAVEHPDVVARLVLVGAVARLSPSGREQEERLGALLDRGRAREAWRELAADALGARASGVLGPVLDVVGRGTSPGDARDAAATCAADVAFDATPRLGAVAAPTLLVVGLRDPSCEPALALQARQRIPHAELLLLPGTGHMASLLHPHAQRRMRQFLDAAPSAGTLPPSPEWSV